MINPTLVNYLKWSSIAPTDAPPRTTPEHEKDLEYHNKRGRNYAASHDGTYSDWYRLMGAINIGFATDQLWGLPEDRELFLMDKGQTTTRRAMRMPITGPMTTRLVGQLSKISIHARASAVTQETKSRMEEQMLKAALYARAAMAGKNMSDAIMRTKGISPDEVKAKSDVAESFQHMLIKPTNALITMIAQKNKLDELRKPIGEMLALTGMASLHSYTSGSHMRWELLNYDEVIWDTNSRRPTMTDGQYAGFNRWASVEDIAERFNVDKATLAKLDKMTSQNGQNDDRTAWPNGQVRYVQLYWKDLRYDTVGYVQGPNGPTLVTIDEPDPDTGEPKYTMGDVIEPPKNRYTKEFKSKDGKRVDTRCVQVARECAFVPYEYMAVRETEPDDLGNKSRTEDIVLKWGKCDVQESDPDDVYSVRLPIIHSTWRYINGFIIAPLSAAQHPQRMSNQVASDITWRTGMGKGNSRFFDMKAAVRGSGKNEKQILTALKNGEDIGVDSGHLGGVQNSVKEMGSGIDPAIREQYGTLEALSKLAENGTGVYKENFGAPGSANKLVGVKRMQEQQADIMMQPFLDATQALYEQAHQRDAQAGRQWYLRHEWALEQMIGTDGLATFQSAKDLEYAAVRVNVTLSQNAEEVMQLTDEYALQLMQLPVPLLDDVSVGELLGKSYPEDLFAAVRKFTKARRDQQMAMAEQQQQQQQAAAMAQEEAMDQERMDELYKQVVDTTLESEKLNQKAAQPVAQAIGEGMKPQPAA